MSESQTDIFGHGSLNNADILRHIQTPELRDRWPENLRDLLDICHVSLAKNGCSENEAGNLSAAIVLAIADHFGGSQFYFPKGDQIKQAMRDREIWQAFDGRNVAALTRQFNLTEVRIYQILAEQRALHSKRVQPSLF